MIDPPGPFEFWKASYLIEVTHLRASSLQQLLTGVTLASDWSLFFHLHDCFFRNTSMLPEYPNDFAMWAHSVLGDDTVAERLANLNLVRSIDISVVRREISTILAEHLQKETVQRNVAPGRDFVFCRPRLAAFATGILARDPSEFPDVLMKADSDSIGYHLFFAPRITDGASINDFSVWFRKWGFATLSAQLDAFDPYLNSLEDNRRNLCELVLDSVKKGPDGNE